MKRANLLLSLSSLIIVAASCKKDNSPSVPVYTVPTTYNFTNFNDTNTLKILAMADQIAAKINTANAAGFGSVTSLIAGNPPRQLQFGLKVNF